MTRCGAGGGWHLTLRPLQLASSAQIPAGVPVGTLAIGRAGAANAGLLAAAILALGDEVLAARLDAYRAEQTAAIPEAPE